MAFSATSASRLHSTIRECTYAVLPCDCLDRSAPAEHSIIDTHRGCQGSVANEAGVIYQSNANTSRPSCKGKDHDCGRNRMAVKQSFDQGKSWQPLVDVWAGPSAYSQLVALGNKELGLLFEAGPVGGNPYDSIVWTTISTNKPMLSPAPAV